ncbi:MAG: hypothetical protein RSE17_04030, partial [Bacilli bacterium]
CDDGTKPLYNSANKTYNINNVTKADTCNVVLKRDFVYSPTTIEYIVPVTGNYVMGAYGAKGENYNSNYQGGNGGFIEGTVILNKGDIINLITGSNTSGGDGFKHGGGYTGFFKNSLYYLRAAGGGAASPNKSGAPGGDGNGLGGDNYPGNCTSSGTAGQLGSGGGSSNNCSYNESYCHHYTNTCQGGYGLPYCNTGTLEGGSCVSKTTLYGSGQTGTTCLAGCFGGVLGGYDVSSCYMSFDSRPYGYSCSQSGWSSGWPGNGIPCSGDITYTDVTSYSCTKEEVSYSYPNQDWDNCAYGNPFECTYGYDISYGKNGNGGSNYHDNSLVTKSNSSNGTNSTNGRAYIYKNID